MEDALCVIAEGINAVVTADHAICVSYLGVRRCDEVPLKKAVLDTQW